MGNSLNEVFPFLLGDGNISGFGKMGNSLNEVFPFLLGDGNISGFPYFEISKFGNDGGTRRFQNARRKSEALRFWGRTILGTHEMTK